MLFMDHMDEPQQQQQRPHRPRRAVPAAAAPPGGADAPGVEAEASHGSPQEGEEAGVREAVAEEEEEEDAEEEGELGTSGRGGGGASSPAPAGLFGLLQQALNSRDHNMLTVMLQLMYQRVEGVWPGWGGGWVEARAGHGVAREAL